MTELQEKFLDALLGEARGNVTRAAEIVGCHPAYGFSLVQKFKDKIIQRAEEILALHAPQAAFGMVDALNGKSSGPSSGKIRLEAAKQILDRAGIVKKDELKVDVGNKGAIIIFPAKNDE